MDDEEDEGTLVDIEQRDIFVESARIARGNLLPLEQYRPEDYDALALPGGRKPEKLARARRLLEAAGLGDRLGHRPAELSGGEQQRAAVARALMNAPALLLADEPTGNLDSLTGMQVLDLVFDLSGSFFETPPALLMVTHSDAIAARCDRTLRLADGRLAPG